MIAVSALMGVGPQRELNGVDPPFYADTLAMIGRMRLDQGRHVDAEPPLVEALERYVARLPEGHRDVQIARLQLGRVRLELGRPGQAAALLRAARDGLAEFGMEEIFERYDGAAALSRAEAAAAAE